MIKRKYNQDELLCYIEKNPNIDNFENKEILIHLDSFCLGDTICFSCFLESFLNYYNPKSVIVSTFFPNLFDSNDRIRFINANQKNEIIVDKLINVGYNKKNLDHTFGGMFYAARESMLLPQNTKMNKPPVKKKERIVDRQKITIGPESIKKISRWDYNNNQGWQTIINYLINKNYVLYNVSFENTLDLENVYSLNGYANLDVALSHIIQSRIFIGLSSGLSWLAWAYDVPVVMIANFTKKYNEFKCYRVVNENVCHGCYNTIADIKSQCPVWLNTIKENECHKKITPEMVINKIDQALLDTN